ncbi:MAG: hypothetical protein PHR06_04965 [Candidatus Cloacimonetes bacterium]|nr:hypothetical protein [Candidatus Cloacimonadota bacterium]
MNNPLDFTLVENEAADTSMPGFDVFCLYMNILAECNGYKLKFLNITKKNNLIAVFPVFFKRNLFWIISTKPPFAYYLKIFYTDSGKDLLIKNPSYKKWIHEIISRYLNENFDFVQGNFDTFETDMRAFIWKGFSVKPAYTYSLDLSSFQENRIDRSEMNKLRKSLKTDFKVKEEIDVGAIKTLANDYGKTLNYNAEFYSFLDKLAEANLIYQYSVYDEENVISSSILLRDDHNLISYALVNLTLRNKMSTGVNSLLMIMIIKNIREKGYRFYDLCGANIPSIADFKSRFATKLETYYHFSSCPSKTLNLLKKFRTR